MATKKKQKSESEIRHNLTDCLRALLFHARSPAAKDPAILALWHCRAAEAIKASRAFDGGVRQ